MKKVKVIESTAQTNSQLKNKYRQKRVAAYCRVSTQQEEQLNSYSTQVKYYTEKIESEPKWKFVGVYADKGITGTDTKKRDEFNKMIRVCPPRIHRHKTVAKKPNEKNVKNEMRIEKWERIYSTVHLTTSL